MSYRALELPMYEGTREWGRVRLRPDSPMLNTVHVEVAWAGHQWTRFATLTVFEGKLAYALGGESHGPKGEGLIVLTDGDVHPPRR